MCSVDEVKETIAYVPIRRGSITVHNESVVHGSGANKSNVSRGLESSSFLRLLIVS